MTDQIAPPDAPWAYAWAKSLDQEGCWLPLWQHQDDSAEVARRLWWEWMPESARRVVSADLGSEDAAARLAVFLVAGHDVGKLCEHFAGQSPTLRDRMARAGFPSPPEAPLRSRDLPHAVVSGHALGEWLFERIGKRKGMRQLAVIPAGHHGVFPDAPCKELPDQQSIWEQSRFQAWDRALSLSGLSLDELGRIADRPLGQPAQVLLTGFTVMCDWIASNRDLFPYGVDGQVSGRADGALDALRLPTPWHPDPPADPGDLFRSRFGFSSGARPRPVQESAVQRAARATEPELMIVEAPTGEGKTEAALAAAEIMASTFGCGGLTIALPTCATSDAMFDRVLNWMRRAVPQEDDVSAVLTHGRAEFNESFRSLFGSGSVSDIRGVHDEPGLPGRAGTIHAHWWMRTRKKSALSTFTVGTIDQFLFAALKSRHLMLRHLGLSGKVVILDEIHVADSYMSVYLDRALEWMGAYGVPVIALSATLTPQRRCAMLAAYRRGSRSRRGEVVADHERPDAVVSAVTDELAYPLICGIGGDEPYLDSPAAGSRSIRYEGEFVGDELSQLVDEVARGVESGGCVAVVRNTVARAQDAYRALTERLGTDRVQLLHSRFISIDRQTRERELVRRLGPPGGTESRPRGLVVVATQVIEQSLDVDFDLMYSDIAPIDLLIQRAGRLHRHTREKSARPESMHAPRILVTGIRKEDPSQPPWIHPGCVGVYGGSALLRTVAVLLEHLSAHDGFLNSPTDIGYLVRHAYSEELSPPEGWEQAWAEAERARMELDAQRANQAAVFLIESPSRRPVYRWNSTPMGDAQEEHRGRAQVRDAESTLDVVLVQNVDGRLRSLPWLEDRGGEYVDDDLGIDDELARIVATCSVSLPAWTLRHGRDAWLIDELEKICVDSWQNSPWLKGVLVLPLDADMKAIVSDLEFCYDRTLGLSVKRRVL